MEKKQYNKEATKKRILEAVGTLIVREGIDSLGINSIAREAGADKVLIYRYFESFDNLLYEYVESKEFYQKSSIVSNLPAKYKSVEEIKNFAKKIFIDQFLFIYNDKELQEIMIWELKSNNEVAKAVAAKRESMGLNLITYFNSFVEDYDIDIHALVAIITSSVIYLALRSKTVKDFNSIEIRKDEGQQRIFDMIGDIIDKYFKSLKLKKK